MRMRAHIHITVWLLVAGQGPDQKGAAKLMAAEVQNRLTVWMLHSWCFEHIVHLMAHRLAFGAFGMVPTSPHENRCEHLPTLMSVSIR